MVNMRKSTGVMLVLTAFFPGTALGVEDAPGRYTMTATENGMLRLDTHTGAVSHCTGTAGQWVCRSVADDRLALENEIDRLSHENRQLKADLARIQKEQKPAVKALEPPTQSPAVPPVMKPQPDAQSSWRPSDEDVEEFMTFFEKIINRFRQIAESMQDDAPKVKP